MTAEEVAMGFTSPIRVHIELDERKPSIEASATSNNANCSKAIKGRLIKLWTAYRYIDNGSHRAKSAPSKTVSSHQLTENRGNYNLRYFGRLDLDHVNQGFTHWF
jgi:hypothetical protein